MLRFFMVDERNKTAIISFLLREGDGIEIENADGKLMVKKTKGEVFSVLRSEYGENVFKPGYVEESLRNLIDFDQRTNK